MLSGHVGHGAQKLHLAGKYYGLAGFVQPCGRVTLVDRSECSMVKRLSLNVSILRSQIIWGSQRLNVIVAISHWHFLKSHNLNIYDIASHYLNDLTSYFLSVSMSQNFSVSMYLLLDVNVSTFQEIWGSLEFVNVILPECLKTKRYMISAFIIRMSQWFRVSILQNGRRWAVSKFKIRLNRLIILAFKLLEHRYNT